MNIQVGRNLHESRSRASTTIRREELSADRANCLSYLSSCIVVLVASFFLLLLTPLLKTAPVVASCILPSFLLLLTASCLFLLASLASPFCRATLRSATQGRDGRRHKWQGA